MEQNNKLRLLSYVVIAYLLMAFAWWSVLLWTKNRDAFYAKRDLLRIGLIAEGLIDSEEAFLNSERYEALSRQYRRQEWMIAGEALFFVISLVIGIWLINRGYHREVTAAGQRRNFLLSITHELKSPIASIQLVFDTFRRRELTPEQKLKLTNTGLIETERLNMLVTDLLLSAKLESAYEPYLESLDMRELLSDLLAKLEDKHPEVTFENDLSTAIKPIRGETMGLTSVVINLLENAIKYSPEDPKIRVSLFQEKEWVVLEIADNGIGIEDREKKKIFEKFYRVGNEDTRKTKGTGLGLFIVKEIVKAHKGRIFVLDNQPTGAIFRILLPVSKNKTHGANPAGRG